MKNKSTITNQLLRSFLAGVFLCASVFGSTDATVPSDASVVQPPVTDGAKKVDLAEARTGVGSADSLSGYRLKDYPVNDLFQYLARLAGKQYFQNPALSGLTISGQMLDGDPLKRMQEVAFQFGISLYEKGNTIYAMPVSEVANMPQRQAEFKLRYLRADQEKLKELLAPYLTKGSGTADYEDKTNTLIISDNEPAIARVRDFLGRVDIPQRQITIQVRIFRVTVESGREWGVSWAQTLGRNGLNIGATAEMALKETFGVNLANKVVDTLTQKLDTKETPSISFTGEESSSRELSTSYERPASDNFRSLKFSPLVANVVLRALYENADSEQESAPTIITEDNETAVFSHLDKIPIVTVTSTTGTGPTVDAPEVRYQPDPEDPFDIGLKLTVKPTILPDDTIRLKITPSIGTITGFQKAGNYEYPKVLLASIENIATVPNGYTLVFGGFTQYSNIKGGDKVPILGDIPLVNFLFSSKSNAKRRTNLVFFVTATAAGVTPPAVAIVESERVRRDLIADPSVQWADDNRVGSTAEADLARTIQNDLTPFAEKRDSGNPISHLNPSNQNLPRIRTPQQATQDGVIQTLPQQDPSATNPPKRGFRPWEAIVPPRS
jgi:type II secretory pathway component GspD/PulD (secretin)